MHIGLQVKYPLFLLHLTFFDRFSKNTHLISWKSLQGTIHYQSRGNRIPVHCRAVARSNGDICQPEDDVLISGDLYRKTMRIRNWKMSCLLWGLLKLNLSSLARVPHPTERTASTILTLRSLMSYIYGAPILDVSRSHTTTQHSR